MVTESSIWITGQAASGKTTYLTKTFQNWLENQTSPSAIILAANHTTRRKLTEQLTIAIAGKHPIVVKTPLGFIEDEVNLFFPLWWEKLNLTPKFPLRLRSETEQELAKKLWHNDWLETLIPNPRSEDRLVRTTLDILQLAAASGTLLEDIPALLSSRLSAEEKAAFGEEATDDIFPLIGELIQKWYHWCLERGFLTYGLIYHLYGQILLPDPTYQSHLTRRYQAIFADDVDDYPAIALDLAKAFLREDKSAVFTFNPTGKARFGLGADPDTWETLANHCDEMISLSSDASPHQADRVLEIVADPSSISPLPASLQHLQTVSRSQLLRQTSEMIIPAIKAGKIAPEDIAIIAPGLDEIARYTLITLFTQHSIPVNPLNEQRPLISSSLVRALLTLTCLVYPNLGRFIETSAIAEMLVILTEQTPHPIDPIRAGLIADYCYQADPISPCLLDIKTFPRWDRISYKGTIGYNQLRHWIEQQKQQKATTPSTPLVSFFNQGIQEFLWKGNNLSVADLSSLRELTKTTQHYWEVAKRRSEQEEIQLDSSQLIQDFIQLLKQGTITANPDPIPTFKQSFPSGITLSNIFQYRSHRRTHRWQFWLDVGSPLWLKQGSANLFASSVFLREKNSLLDLESQEQKHLERILNDLLNRATEKVYLCHSDLAVNGSEQNGILLSLVPATSRVAPEVLSK